MLTPKAIVRPGRRLLPATALLVLGGGTPAYAHDDGPLAPHDLWTAWSLEPAVVLGIGLATALYVRGTARVWRRAGVGRGVRRREVAAFAAGILALVVALVSPLDALGGTLFTAHMVQHELLMLVAAPLLVLARPFAAWVWALPPDWRRRVGRGSNAAPVRTIGRLLLRPSIAWILYAAAFLAWHAPNLYQATLESDLVHSLQHASFFGAALLFWWTVVHPRTRRRTGYAVGVLCVFTTFLYSGIFGALLTFSSRPWYPAYASRVEPWGLTPLQDQHLGGLIMWIPSGLAYVVAALALVLALLRTYRPTDAPETRPSPSLERARTRARTFIASVLVLAAAGCRADGFDQNILDPAGPAATRIETLWWLFLAIATFVVIAVTALLLYGLVRARATPPGAVEASDRRKTRAVAGGVGATIVLLGGMFGASLLTGRATLEPPGTAPRTVQVIGHRFWWEVRYPLEDDTIVTANEIHLPAGEPVRFEVTTADVIHSFWIPNLHGKIDMIPGRVNTIRVQADEPGEYRGQCAEFCGMQHANMGFMVVVETPDEFAAWLAAQREPAPQPTDTLAVRGLQTFLDAGCAACHTIRGTPADGQTGPELTHLADRLTLAAGMLPNTRGHLGGWIVNPQRIKPGNNMPGVSLEPIELRALLHYLETLD